MKFLKSEVFRLFSIGFAAGALLVAAPLAAASVDSGQPARAASTR